MADHLTDDHLTDDEAAMQAWKTWAAGRKRNTLKHMQPADFEKLEDCMSYFFNKHKH